jgi:hypothetical protein
MPDKNNMGTTTNIDSAAAADPGLFPAYGSFVFETNALTRYPATSLGRTGKLVKREYRDPEIPMATRAKRRKNAAIPKTLCSWNIGCSSSARKPMPTAAERQTANPNETNGREHPR